MDSITLVGPRHSFVNQPDNRGMSVLRGERVLIERRRIGMNQDVLGARVGVDRTYISQIENNRDLNVGIKTIVGLAEALGVTVPYLLGITDDPLGEGTEQVQKEMSGEYVAIDVDNQELRKLVQETIDLLITLPPRDRRIALDLLRSMRKIEEEESVPLVPRIIE